MLSYIIAKDNNNIMINMYADSEEAMSKVI